MKLTKSINLIILSAMLTFTLDSCKKSIDDISQINTKQESNSVNNADDEVSQIEGFIIQVKSTLDSGAVYDNLPLEDAIFKIEHAVNYSFSKLDKPFKDQSNNDSFTFILDSDAGMVKFTDLSEICENIANFVNSVTNDDVKLVVAAIEKIDDTNNSHFRLKLILGTVDGTIDLTAPPVPSSITGDHNWSKGTSTNFFLGCQGGDIGAVEIIRSLGEKLMIAHRNQLINQIGIAAPPGYEVYFNRNQPVEYGGISQFSHSDVTILSKFDWNNNFSVYCQKTKEPSQSPIFHVFTESIDNGSGLEFTFPCQLQISSTNYAFKCCMQEDYLNYLISKVDDIYEFVFPGGKGAFTSFHITAFESGNHYDPIQHKYMFTYSKPYVRPSNTNVTL